MAMFMVEYQNLFRNAHEITYPISPSPFMERGVGGEVYGQVISDRFLSVFDSLYLWQDCWNAKRL